MTKTVLKIGANSLTEYDAWMKASSHGDVLVYWVGDLASDRTTILKVDEEMRKRLNVINAVANRVLGDNKSGDLVLFQKRKKEGVSEYWAMRVRKKVGQSVVDAIIQNSSIKVLEFA